MTSRVGQWRVAVRPWPGDATCGCFRVPAGTEEAGYRTSVVLHCIASSESGWDHVSVHADEDLVSRTPTWDEMMLVHRLFFTDRETSMQLCVPPSEHVSCHPHTLHLWRPQRGHIPRPPGWMV